MTAKQSGNPDSGSCEELVDRPSSWVETILPILEALGVEMIDHTLGYAVCPGVGLHTTPNAPHDCIAYNNGGTPFLHCLHQSCRSIRQALNSDLYRAARAAEYAPGKRADTKVERQRQKAYQEGMAELERERRLAANSLPNILGDYEWTVNAVVADSPEPIGLPVDRHWQLLLCLFEEDDIVWIGRDKFDSGSPGHRWRFRRSIDWLAARSCPGSFVCSNPFRPGVHQRLAEHVLAPKFLVLESDTLAHDQACAMFRWVMTELKLPLRVIVDSGNKSLHGWFEYPPPNILHKLRLWLPAMGFDPALFALNQPCRLPGARRPETGRYQRLLYLA